MNIIPDTESTFSKKKPLILFGCAALTILAAIKFKKQLKTLMNLDTKLAKEPFSPINQHKKIVHQACGTWKKPRENTFDEKEFIIISNKAQLREKLQKMKIDGLQELQICSDFDQTITAFGSKEHPQPATFGLIRQSNTVSEEFKNSLTQFYMKYHPYERDSSLSKEQKAIYMGEWNDGVSEAFHKEGLSKENILRAFEDSNLSLRFNFKEYLKCLCEINLPFYVISGGISPILQTMLDSIMDTNKQYSNFFMFCNEGHFDQNGILTRMDMVVNTCSKDEKVNRKEFQLRKNTLLFGDYHHDIYMKTQLESENVISILFLRDSMASDIEDLQKDWDIIIRGDGSYILHQAITTYIAGEEDWCDLNLAGDAESQFTNNPIYNEIKSLFA